MVCCFFLLLLHFYFVGCELASKLSAFSGAQFLAIFRYHRPYHTSIFANLIETLSVRPQHKEPERSPPPLLWIGIFSKVQLLVPTMGTIYSKISFSPFPYVFKIMDHHLLTVGWFPFLNYGLCRSKPRLFSFLFLMFCDFHHL